MSEEMHELLDRLDDLQLVFKRDSNTVPWPVRCAVRNVLDQLKKVNAELGVEESRKEETVNGNVARNQVEAGRDSHE